MSDARQPEVRSSNFLFSLPATCRLFSRGVIFTRARVSLALLSLRKNGGLLRSPQPEVRPSNFLFSYKDYLPETSNQPTPQWCKKSTSGWRPSLIKLPILPTFYISPICKHYQSKISVPDINYTQLTLSNAWYSFLFTNDLWRNFQF